MMALLPLLKASIYATVPSTHTRRLHHELFEAGGRTISISDLSADLGHVLRAASRPRDGSPQSGHLVTAQDPTESRIQCSTD
jgi:hypothetical protein